MDSAAGNLVNISDVVVYLVDDDRGMVGATSQWLSLSGLKVRAFADPAALIKVVKTSQPCVVISDIRMPGIDGMQLMKLIQSKDKRIPVILITGHGDIPLAVEAMKLGAFEFLPKPFSPEKLLEITRKAQELWTRVEVQASSSPSVPASEEKAPVPGIVPEGTLPDQVEGFEKEIIEATMKKHRGAIPKVMEELGIPRRTLNAKMKKYDIVRAKYR